MRIPQERMASVTTSKGGVVVILESLPPRGVVRLQLLQGEAVKLKHGRKMRERPSAAGTCTGAVAVDPCILSVHDDSGIKGKRHGVDMPVAMYLDAACSRLRNN
jgi:hypothetical protein